MTVDIYIYDQKEPTKSILDYVHNLFLLIVPEINCTIKWNVPYYSLNDAMFYLNPIKKKGGGIEVCFVRARKYEDAIELLDFKDRKVVGGLTLFSLESIDEKVLVKLIEQALLADKNHIGETPWK